jgi:hypothetical protein
VLSIITKGRRERERREEKKEEDEPLQKYLTIDDTQL